MNALISLPKSLPVVTKRIQESARKSSAGGFSTLSFRAMGTHCQVKWAVSNAGNGKQFEQNLIDWIGWFEAQYSRFITDSLIGTINSFAGVDWVEVDEETDNIFNFCQEMYFLTRGVFDPTALPLISLWNWKANPPVIPTDVLVSQVRELVGWRKIQRRPGAIFLPKKGMAIDLGGMGKEYAVDRAITMALDHGINDVLVDFGQDVRVHGQSPERGPWHVGLEDPKTPGKCWTGVAVNDHAVATSGDYLRNFTAGGRRYGHIIDARNGYPVNNGCLSVSVVAPYCTVAGIMSTSAFVLGPKEGISLMSMCPGVEGAIITNHERFHTRNFLNYATNN